MTLHERAEQVAGKACGGYAFSHKHFPYGVLVDAIESALREVVEECARVAEIAVDEESCQTFSHTENLWYTDSIKVAAAIRRLKE